LNDSERGLTKLSLGLNNFKDPTLKYFIQTLKNNESLINVKIFFWEFSLEGSLLFIDFLKNPLCKLKILDLCTLNMSDRYEVFKKLIESLKVNTTIETLNLTHCELDYRHLNLLMKSLKVNPTVKHLDLRENLINYEHVKKAKAFLDREIVILI
jgi:hypothetical protein